VEKTKSFQLALSILIYDEDGRRVAHCLEMDLKGRGKSDRAALKELSELVLMQVSFAVQRDEKGLIYHPAEKKYFEIFREIQTKALSAYPAVPKPSKKSRFSISQMLLPEPDCDCFAPA